MGGIPDNVFVYDKDVRDKSAVDEIIDKIDYQYYIDRAYERILEFTKIKKVKDIVL